MKVILLEDVKGKGKKSQLIEVSTGYARNYLLPKKLAVEASADNLNTMKLQEKARQAQIAEEIAQAQSVADQLKNVTVNIYAKSGSGGRLFGAVTTREISEALKSQYGIEIGKSKLVLDDVIKSCGIYQIKAKLGHDIVAVVNVHVLEK